MRRAHHSPPARAPGRLVAGRVRPPVGGGGGAVPGRARDSLAGCRDACPLDRDELDQKEVLRSEALHEAAEKRRIIYRTRGSAASSRDKRDVVIGISPAFGVKLFQTVGGHPLSEVLGEMTEAIAARGLKPRVVRFKHTADTSFLGLSAARLAGSGIGIGLQAKGTAVIHQRSRLPHRRRSRLRRAGFCRRAGGASSTLPACSAPRVRARHRARRHRVPDAHHPRRRDVVRLPDEDEDGAGDVGERDVGSLVHGLQGIGTRSITSRCDSISSSSAWGSPAWARRILSRSVWWGD